jgi:type II secretory pathway predicted ATPase ExeA
MYHAHWGLRDTPFRAGHDPRFFYQSPTHEEALARLHFLVEEHRRLGLLLGEQGCGKSFLLEMMAAEIGRSGASVVRMSMVGLEPVECLARWATQMGLSPGRAESIPQLWRRITDRLAEHQYDARATIFLLDDAHLAGPAELAHVLRLAHCDPSPQSRLTLILTSTPGDVGRLGGELLELVELRIDLEPWEPAETQQYVQQSLAQAGRQTPVFAASAMLRLHDLTQGVPRRVSQLADLALLAGAGRNLDEIDAQVVDSVYEELGVIRV